mmetsp:Transcript_32879/g.82447  ORF Transcript_32879/g.82447 Transcript_32879/m.82447 type:complete len:233 (-) Transcript_32879:103-801(-)
MPWSPVPTALATEHHPHQTKVHTGRMHPSQAWWEPRRGRRALSFARRSVGRSSASRPCSAHRAPEARHALSLPRIHTHSTQGTRRQTVENGRISPTSGQPAARLLETARKHLVPDAKRHASTRKAAQAEARRRTRALSRRIGACLLSLVVRRERRRQIRIPGDSQPLPCSAADRMCYRTRLCASNAAAASALASNLAAENSSLVRSARRAAGQLRPISSSSRIQETSLPSVD